MKQLVVRNLDERLVQVLKLRAAAHGVSMEAEHRNILAQALLQPAKRSFAEVLARMPNVGGDADFARSKESARSHVLD